MPHWSLSRPIASARLMVRVAVENGVSVTTCLANTGLVSDDLDHPAREIEGRQELTVLRNILKAVDPNLPYTLIAGERYHVTTHGMWGFGLISSRTLRGAIEFTEKYFDLSYSFNRFSVEYADGQVQFIYDDSDNPEDLRAALVERDMGAAITFGRDICGFVIPTQTLQLRGPQPAYAAAFVERFGVTPQFNAPRNILGIDAALLDVLAPTMGDELAQQLSEAQCRELLTQRNTLGGVAGRVRRRILSKPGEFPSMNTVARDLGMTTRTLRNHLQRETTSYRELLHEIREKLAEELLSSQQLAVDEVAVRLGYADTSAFVTAFKRWKNGVSPGSYKKNH